MKKLFILLLIAFVGQGSFVYGAEYKKLSQLPTHSTIRNKCENIDKIYFRKKSVRSACLTIDEMLDTLENVSQRRAELQTESSSYVHEKEELDTDSQKIRQNLLEAARTVLNFESLSAQHVDYAIVNGILEKNGVEIKKSSFL